MTASPGTRRAVGLVAAGLATMSLAACAPQGDSKTDDFSGVEGEVQDTVQKLADRADDGNAAAICRELFTPKLQATVARGGTCADGVERAIQNADYTTLDVQIVRISQSDPTKASAIIDTVEDTGQRQLNLIKGTDGKWRIDSLAVKVSPTSPAASTPAPSATTPTTPSN